MATNKALLVGINYMGSSSALNGCINDIKNVRQYLGERFRVVKEVRLDEQKKEEGEILSLADAATALMASKEVDVDQLDEKSLDGAQEQTTDRFINFLKPSAKVASKPPSKVAPPTPVAPVVSPSKVEDAPTLSSLQKLDTLEVLILTDDQKGKHVPTKANILDGIRWLVAGTKSRDKRFFHYSGHGSYVFDTSGDEADGRDECLCPVDYNTAGFIVDDDLRKVLIDLLPEGAQLRVILDACHTHTCLDQRYTYTTASSLLGKDTKVVVSEDKKAALTKADVVCWSGCLDSQTSADAFINGSYNGALTATFLEILRDKAQSRKYHSLFDRLTRTLQERRYTQKAQLTSGKLLDMDKDSFDLF